MSDKIIKKAQPNQRGKYPESIHFLAEKVLKKIDPPKLVAFLPMKGKRYTGELMVVGRAVNDWDEKCKFDGQQLLNKPKRMNFAQKVYDVSKGQDDRCPMSWVSAAWKNKNREEYNTKRSAFWRVIREIGLKLNLFKTEETNWPSRLVWSNLYKISPSGGGNPEGSLEEKQKEGCIELFHWEIGYYKPRRVLFLTGLNWADEFLRSIRVNSRKVRRKYVEEYGRLRCGKHIAAYVVVKHPQGKEEAPLVKEVVGDFNRLS